MKLLYSCVHCGYTTAVCLLEFYCKKDKGKFVLWARHEGVYVEYQHMCGFIHGGSAWNCVTGTALAYKEVQLPIE